MCTSFFSILNKCSFLIMTSQVSKSSLLLYKIKLIAYLNLKLFIYLLEMGDPDTTRLEYTIKACSTEAPGHPAENLSNFTTSGWRSSDLCDYPQSIICKLATEAELRRIQLLGHNFLIPQRVVLYVGNFHNKYEKHIWKKIGFVTFSGFYR